MNAKKRLAAATAPNATPVTNAPTPIARRALRPKEACEALGLGKTKLFELLKSGKLKSVRVGSARLIPVECIEALLAERS